MAKKYFYSHIPKTCEYIDSLDEDRSSHHNYVIEQHKYLNSNIAVAEMTSDQLLDFDNECLDYLKNLDSGSVGRPATGRLNKPFQITLSPETFAKLEILKVKTGGNRSKFIAELIESYPLN